MARVNLDKSRRSYNYSAGRPYGAPNVIVIHHWGTDGQRFETPVSWLCRVGGTSSAHYVVEAGHVAELVDCGNRAWHAGKLGNPRGIGIECRPECRPGDFEEVAKLIADLRDRFGPLPLARHCDYMSTDCPGRWGSRLAELSALAEKYRGSKPAPSSGIKVDGYAGGETVSKAQTFFNTTVDGRISGQYTRNKVYFPNFTTVDFSPRAEGSQLVIAIQKFLNSRKPATLLVVDGVLGAATIMELQRFLNKEMGAGLVVDGIAGYATVCAFQRWLNTK